MQYRTVLFLLIQICGASIVLGGAFVCGALMYCMHYPIITLEQLDRYQPIHPTIILDDAGNEWTRFTLDRRDPVPLSQVPPSVIQAFVAAEDRTFFSHSGISVRGIIRSIWANLWAGRLVQGASTITQQLVKLLILDSRKTFKRKIMQQIMAVAVERFYTKEQILEAYLNHVYFGAGIVGVQAACQRFWGIDVSEVNVAQAAALAAIVRSPATYCPLIAPHSCERRMQLILKMMLEQNMIDEQMYHDASQYSVVVQEASIVVGSPAVPAIAKATVGQAKTEHYKNMIRALLEKIVGKQELYTGGYIVQATLNTSMQQSAVESFSTHIEQLKNTYGADVDGALLSIDGATGHIKALVGGANFALSQFNRATQARRQLGSIFKPLVYAAALQKGYTFADTMIDEPITAGIAAGAWKPRNYHDRFEGQMSLAYALSRSFNIIPVKLLQEIGAQPIISLAHACHLEMSEPYYPSLALGTAEATVAQAVGMINMFAHHGNYVQPHAIVWVKDRWGKKIWHADYVPQRVLEPIIADQVAHVMTHALERRINTPAISKTGTTNDSRTCWFIGATPTITTGIYIGCDNNRSLGAQVYPVKTSRPIWLSYHRALSLPAMPFTHDPRLKMVTIDPMTGGFSKDGMTILINKSCKNLYI